MVMNRQKFPLSLDVSNNRPIIAKYRETFAKIFLKDFLDMLLFLEKKTRVGCRVFHFRFTTPFHFCGQVPIPGLGLEMLVFKLLKTHQSLAFFPFSSTPFPISSLALGAD